MWNNVQEKPLLRKASEEIRKSMIPLRADTPASVPFPAHPSTSTAPRTQLVWDPVPPSPVPHPYSAAMDPFGFLLSPSSSFRSRVWCHLTPWPVPHCCLFVCVSRFVGLRTDCLSPPQDFSPGSQNFAFSLSAQHGHGTLLKLMDCVDE